MYPPIYFTQLLSKKFNKSIFKYNQNSDKVSIVTHETLDLDQFFTIQVGKNLFGYKNQATPAEFVMWSDLESTQ